MPSTTGTLNEGLSSFNTQFREFLDNALGFQGYIAQGIRDFQEGLTMITSFFGG